MNTSSDFFCHQHLPHLFRQQLKARHSKVPCSVCPFPQFLHLRAANFACWGDFISSYNPSQYFEYNFLLSGKSAKLYKVLSLLCATKVIQKPYKNLLFILKENLPKNQSQNRKLRIFFANINRANINRTPRRYGVN